MADDGTLKHEDNINRALSELTSVIAGIRSKVFGMPVLKEGVAPQQPVNNVIESIHIAIKDEIEELRKIKEALKLL